MKKLVLLFALVGCVPYQAPPVATYNLATAAPPGQIGPGSTFWVAMDQTVSPRTHRPGDQFTATTTGDLVGQDGRLLIPRGSRVFGRITQLTQPRGGYTGSVRLSIEGLDMYGFRQPIAASVRATQVPSPARVEPGAVLWGAALGSIIGGITHGGEGALVGGAIGGGSGALLSLGANAQNAELPAGTQLELRVERPLTAAPLRS
jgi:hypothetical protein